MNKLILFDIDKTLVKSTQGRAAQFSTAFKEIYGINASIDIIQYSGMTDQQIIIDVLKLKGLDEKEIESKLESCMEKMVRLFQESIENHEIIILPGVNELLKVLENNNFLIGLATGNLEQIAHGKMKKLEIDHYFKVGGYGSEHINRTELVKIAIKKAQSDYNFNVANNVYLFGDAPQDMRAAKNADVIAVGVTTGVYSKNELENAGADIVLNDLMNTKRIMNEILK